MWVRQPLPNDVDRCSLVVTTPPTLKSSASLIQVSVVLLSGMLEDSVIQPWSQQICWWYPRSEGDGRTASWTGADYIPVCCRRSCKSDAKLQEFSLDCYRLSTMSNQEQGLDSWQGIHSIRWCRLRIIPRWNCIWTCSRKSVCEIWP